MVRHEALVTVRAEMSAAGLSQQVSVAEGSLSSEMRARTGAALTKSGRTGTTRRSGSGEQGRKVQGN